ncbi:UNVERIFIED_CONTAM: hypothetical protein HDU68_009065 [Siphonaria sp. JEL0065]|nr:hypothetical protein HDU68_009065 [Siphonaria sp. JEL0065]
MSTSHNQKRSNVSKSEAEKLKTQQKINEYRETWKRYLDAKTAIANDVAALETTTAILELNPDAYSAWNFRRRVLMALWTDKDLPMSQDDIQAMAHSDLKFIEKLVRVYPKSYWLWLHRRWVLENMPHPDWNRELKLCQMMLDMDPRNFHGWDYRRIILAKAGKSSNRSELEYSMAKIHQNFSNYSAWHYRSKLIPRITGFAEGERQSIIQKDFEIVRNAIYTEPADQSAWLYQRWLLGQEQQPLTVEWSHKALQSDRSITLFVCFNYAVSVDPKNVAMAYYGNTIHPHNVSLNPSGIGRHVFAAKLSNTDAPTSVRLTFPRSAFRFFKGQFFSGDSLVVDWNASDSGVASTEKSVNDSVTAGSLVKDQYQSREIWIREMESIRELVEVEPDSKWPLMSLVHVLHELKGYSQEAIGVLEKLKTVDPDRINFYSDYVSAFYWDLSLEQSPPSVSNELIIPESYRLTRIVTPHLLSPLIARVVITNQKLTSLPQFPCVQVLIVDDNLITGFEDIQWLFELKELSVKRNRIKSLEGLKKARSSLRLVFAEGNVELVDTQTIDGLEVSY